MSKRTALTEEQIRDELHDNELEIIDLSLPQMTGGMKTIVELLAVERIQNRMLVRALKCALNALDRNIGDNPEKTDQNDYETIKSALREAGEEV